MMTLRSNRKIANASTTSARPRTALQRSTSLPRVNFFHKLPAELGNEVYSYLTFPPLDLLDPDGYSGLGLTCRQAWSETSWEANRQFWNFLVDTKKEYQEEMGKELLFSKKLKGPDDLQGLKELKVVVSEHIFSELAWSLGFLTRLQLHSLKIHCTHWRRPFDTLLFQRILKPVPLHNRKVQLKKLTLTWDGSSEPTTERTMLDGRLFQLEDDEVGCEISDRTLPVFVSTLDGNMGVGLMQLRMDLQKQGGGERVKMLMNRINREEDIIESPGPPSKEEECQVTFRPVR
jgi:hypothetical protein